MQNVVTVPRGPTSTVSVNPTPQRGHAPRGGTFTRLHDGQRLPMTRLFASARRN